MEMNELDRHDVLLLAELQRDSRQTVQQLAAAVGLSGTPCWKRVKELEARGVIRGYTAQVDREKVGLSLRVIAELNLVRHQDDDVLRFEKAVASCPQIVSCYATTGQADYVIMVLAPDIRSYERFLHARAFKGPGVPQVGSCVVLKYVTPYPRLPRARPAAPRTRRRG